MDLHTLSRHDITRDYLSCETLGEVLRQIDLLAKNHGQVVCSIEVNGNRIGEADEGRLAKCLRTEIESLSYSTERPLALVRQTAIDAIAYISKISEVVESVSVEYRSRPDAAAVQTLKQIIQSLLEANSILEYTKAVGLETSTVGLSVADRDIETKAWVDLETSWRVSLTELAEAFQKRDFILMADLLEYEVTEFLRVGAVRLETMATRLKEVDGSKEGSICADTDSVSRVSSQG